MARHAAISKGKNTPKNQTNFFKIVERCIQDYIYIEVPPKKSGKKKIFHTIAAST